MSTFDVVLIDLQDVGCRIYTFITTLLYMLEACAKDGKEVWCWIALIRRSAGRGPSHSAGWEAYVGGVRCRCGTA